MLLATKYFGQVDCAKEDVLTFPSGLFGFESETRFLLLPFAGSDQTLLCLQSVSTPLLAFVVMNPFSLRTDYAPQLQPSELESMAAECSQDLCYYVMCVVKSPVAESTVNLRCPIVVNEDTRRAAQVILDTPEYEMRHLLSEFNREGARSPC